MVLGPRRPSKASGSPIGSGLLTIYRISGYNFAALATTAIGSLIIARILGPTGKGIVAGATVWTALLVEIGSLGIPHAITYEIAKGSDEADVRTVAQRFAGRQIVALLAIGTLIFGLMMPSTLRRSAWFFLLTVPLAFVLGYRLAELQGRRLYTRWNRLRTVSTVAPVLFGLIAATLFSSSNSVLAGFAFGTFISAAMTIVGSQRIRRDKKGARGPLEGRMLRYGLRTGLTGVMAGANQQLDQAVLALVIPAAGLGIYAAAVSLSTILMPLSAAYASYAIADLASIQTRELQHQLARRLTWQSAGFFIVASGAGAVLGPRLLVLAFGSAFSGGATTVRILFIAAGFLAEDYFLVHALLGMGLTSPPLFAQAVGLCVTLVMLAILVPRIGYVGAAWASLAAYAVASVILLTALLRDRRATFLPC